MKFLYKYCFLFFIAVCFFTKQASAHSVQVGYCVSCMGELTLYVEHWHANADPSSTTMTIQLNINGVITTQTGSPIDNIQDTPYSDLPGCTNPITIFSSCGSGEANTYNDWVVFKFPNLPTGVPVVITITSGNTVFTEDGCSMYPASSPQIIVPPIINPPPIADSSRSICEGDSAILNLTNYFSSAFQWQSAPTPTGPWTDIPGATSTPFNTGPLTTTTHYRATAVGTCESNYVTITVNPAVVPTSGLGPGTGTGAGADTTICPSSTPVNIGTPSTPGYTYSWLPTTALSNPTISNPTVSITTPNTNTTYILTTTTSFGCASKDSVQVIVKQIPLSNAGSDVTTCTYPVPDSIGTTNTPGYSYSWSPATNLSSATSSNPTVNVSSAGTTTYVVTTTYQGCVSSDSVVVEVNPLPVAAFSIQDVCLGLPFDAQNTSTVATGSIADSLFDFADGSPASGNGLHYCSAPGTYAVTLIVTTDKGCMDTVSHNATVHPNPVAQFTANNVCDNTPVQFSESSTIDAPDIIQTWVWSFGDGDTLSSQTVTGGYLYADPDSYNARLVAVSDFGCFDSITKIIIVNPNPEVSFVSADTVGCEPLCITFQNQSSILSGLNVSWVLDYGDGSGTSNSELSHCYDNSAVYAPAYYTPVLTVTSDSGCVTTLSKDNYITVYPNPVAAFEIDQQTTTVMDPNVSVTNLSAGADTWNWDFGDMQTSIAEYPSMHTYADTGSFLITLITNTQYGCADTASQLLIVEPEFAFYVPNVFTPNGDGINDTFNGNGIFVEEFSLKIFNRWGDEIFFSNNINIPWDGKANYGSQVAQPDVYIYVINVKDIKNKVHDYRGTVTLVR